MGTSQSTAISQTPSSQIQQDDRDNSSSVLAVVNTISDYTQATRQDSNNRALTKDTKPSDKNDNRQVVSVATSRSRSLNGLLDDIYTRFISIKDSDFDKYYTVSCKVIDEINKKMKTVDPYYRKYSGRKQFAGSHFDGLRISKPDEFDLDIIIDMPINFEEDPDGPAKSDIVLEHIAPGFVQLRMGSHFQNLPKRDDWDTNKTAWYWMDEETKFLLQSNFQRWFESVVKKGLNYFQQKGDKAIIVLNDTIYEIRYTKSGPAKTLVIESSNGFRCDVDLVPAIRFPESRWPVSKVYRKIPSGCEKGYWMVVPKENKTARTPQDAHRSWRIALHDQEKQLMYKCERLKHSIRLIKKLRDTQKIDKIASYYIKTIFFHERVCNSDSFWSSSNAEIFKTMVKKFHEYISAGNIPYFWNKNNNLIGQVNRQVLNNYAKKIENLIKVLDNNSVQEVANYLLTAEELYRFNCSL